ncbi:MAG: endonuclease/exonuclease/phosphatase family protein [Candidatus Izemoplasmataceae bacterium]
MKKRIVRPVLILLSIVMTAFALLLLILTVTEYRPEEAITLSVEGATQKTLAVGDTLTLMTYNIGYGGLGREEDFVMDGGEKGRPDSKADVLDYLGGSLALMENNESDVYFLQEVDEPSRRSYAIDQVSLMHETLGEDGFMSSFAYNFKVVFVPFPVSLTDHLGRVESGIQTLSAFEMDEATRYQFPGEFSWPLRTANLKRAMMVNRLPLEGTDKELVLINLHMSAYDDGSLREQEMAFFNEILENEKDAGNYVIAGGDFNQTFPEAEGVYPVVDEDSFIAPLMDGDALHEGYRFAVDISAPTSRLLNMPYDPEDPLTQYYIIDGFVVSENISVDWVETIDYDFRYSDHNPVRIRVELTP